MQHELLGKNIEDVQRQNQISVLQVLRQQPGQLSRKQISSMLGLTPGTVTNIVRDRSMRAMSLKMGTWPVKRAKGSPT